MVVANPGVSDSELVSLLPGGKSRHQQINQRCRNLATQGRIRREPRPDRRIGNYAVLQKDAEKLDESAKRSVSKPKQIAIAATTLGVSYRWHSAGEVVLGKESKLIFPRLEAIAGIYRLRLTDTREVYIGEAVNLRRRMQNYRTPGPRQSTSIRLNNHLLDTVRSNGVIFLDVCSDVTIEIEKKPVSLELTSKTVRLFVESAALMVEAEGSWTILNSAD